MSISDDNAAVTHKQLLGQVLIERGNITRAQLSHALQIQEKQRDLIGMVLVDLGYVSERDIVTALVVQCHVPYIAIDQYDIDRNALDMIPKDIAQKYQVIPLDQVNRILSIVMADPLDMEVKSEIQNLTNCRIVPFIATHGEIKKAIRRWYEAPVT